ncbi:MAG: CHAT domain-containing protein [Nitrospira sp.]
MQAGSNTVVVNKNALHGASLLLFGTLMLLPAEPLYAQFWAKCSEASESSKTSPPSNSELSELDFNIQQHHQHMFRLEGKFDNEWYLQGHLPSTLKPFDLKALETVFKAYSVLKPPFGVLFYTYSTENESLCIWLLGSNGQIERKRNRVSQSDFDAIRPRLLAALGAVPAGSVRDSHEIRKITDDLMPAKIVSVIEQWKLARLLIVPIFDLGEIPYAALILKDGRLLMDVVRITILPGFYVLGEQPQRRPSGQLEESFIAAYEGGSGCEPTLKHALAGTDKVKKLLGVKPETPVLRRVREASKWLRAGASPRFIFIAAHGVSNQSDPVDGGYVCMEDGRWTGRQVADLRMNGGLKSNPIVILSACESGTGKMFDVGAIGLSRAWYYAGASTVVASLWRVDELKAMELMESFVEKAKSLPPDEALWKAMQALRAKNNPVDWAAFSVFGGLLTQ